MHVSQEEIKKIHNRLLNWRSRQAKPITMDQVEKLFSYIHGLEAEINMRLGLETKYVALKNLKEK